MLGCPFPLDIVVRELELLEFAAAIAVEGINVLREPAGDGKVSSFECFSLVGRKYFNKDRHHHFDHHVVPRELKIRILKIP